MLRIIIAIGALLTLAPLEADETTKAAKLTELMKLKGLYAVIEQQQDYTRLQAEEIGRTVLRQTRAEYPTLSAQALGQLQAAEQEFVQASRPSWTVDEVVELWQQYYGDQVTEQELDQILAYYRSPIGRKDLAASESVLPRWTTFIAERNQSVVETQTRQFMIEAQQILAAEP